MGHGQCLIAAPDIFDLDDDAIAIVTGDRPTEEALPRIREAVQRCPEGAIALQEER